MQRPHASDDVRERALAAIAEGRSVADVAAFFQNDPSTIRRWIRQRQVTGSPRARARSGRPPKIAVADRSGLVAQVAAQPDATFTEHCQTWHTRHGVMVSISTMQRHLLALGITRQKDLDRCEQDAEARAAWQADLATVVFLDETSTPTTLTRRTGRSPRGGEGPEGALDGGHLTGHAHPDRMWAGRRRARSHELRSVRDHRARPAPAARADGHL